MGKKFFGNFNTFNPSKLISCDFKYQGVYGEIRKVPRRETVGSGERVVKTGTLDLFGFRSSHTKRGGMRPVVTDLDRELDEQYGTLGMTNDGRVTGVRFE